MTRSHYQSGDTHVTPAEAGAWREDPFPAAKRRDHSSSNYPAEAHTQ